MHIPKKITPDYLKDTIVEIRCSVNIPKVLIPGYLLNILAPSGFSYVPVPISPGASGVNISLGPNQQVGIDIGGGTGFYQRDKIRIQIMDNLIIFNCLEDNYIGWDSYLETIQEVIIILQEKNFTKSFNRVSVRYISEFKNIEIYKNMRGAINFENIGLNLENSMLRLVDESQNIKTFVVLTNKGKMVKAHTGDMVEASLVDINVFENFNPTSDINILTEKLNDTHSKQKEVFFGLISESFLTALNPEY